MTSSLSLIHPIASFYFFIKYISIYFILVSMDSLLAWWT